MAKKKDSELYDSELMPKDLSKDRIVAQKAFDHVLNIFKTYQRNRIFSRGGQQVDIIYEWDKRYRAYKCIFNSSDHSYNGTAKTFSPALRKAVNTIESEATNALFSREDYFAVDAQGSAPENEEMARNAFGVIKHYSDLEQYVGEYELAIKQALIYDHTCVENVYIKELVEGIYRKADQKPVLDPQTQEPMMDPNTRMPVMRKEYNLYKINDLKASIRVEVRDIYRLYINHISNNPEREDMIYRDSMSPQTLLTLVEQGVYNRENVNKMLKSPPTYDRMPDRDSQVGDGKSFLSDMNETADDNKTNLARYEVLRFQGLFTTEDEETGQKIKKQFWIDIGERSHVLRVIQNPLIGGWKTFSVSNYDTMPFEFYSDSVLSPYLALQYEINDKENQSLDALTHNLNAPYEVKTGSGLKSDDLIKARRKPNMAIFVKEMDSIKKIQSEVPVNHLNIEIVRLNSSIDSGTGATSLASGAPSGTQADRSGKALNTLLTQTRSQFSKFVRKFERNLIERSLQKTLDMLLQFFDDDIEIEIMGESGKKTLRMQSPAEVVGRFCVKVSTGSEYLKERETRDSLLEFISILRVDDTFMQLVDRTALLRDIAATMPNNMAKYIDPENLISKLYGQIQQLQKIIESQSQSNGAAMAEVQRLSGVVKQTDRANEASPSMADTEKQMNQVKAKMQGGGI